MAYILIARSRCSRGKTRTKHIFAQDRIGAPSPQTSVHFEVTSGVVKSFWSVPGSYIEGVKKGGAMSGCMTVQCLSESHSAQLRIARHSLAT